jgi:hypothetical protein
LFAPSVVPATKKRYGEGPPFCGSMEIAAAKIRRHTVFVRATRVTSSRSKRTHTLWLSRIQMRGGIVSRPGSFP